MDQGEQWLTYQQAGQRLGISAEAARQRARRLGWRHRASGTNEGPRRTLILVPDADLQAAQQPEQEPAHAAGQTGGQTPPQAGQANGSAGEVAALHALADTLREQLAKADARAGAAEEREAAGRAVAERQGRELTAALLRTAIAETEARGLREALAEARRPAWRRWLGMP